MRGDPVPAGDSGQAGKDQQPPHAGEISAQRLHRTGMKVSQSTAVHVVKITVGDFPLQDALGRVGQQPLVVGNPSTAGPGDEVTGGEQQLRHQ